MTSAGSVLCKQTWRLCSLKLNLNSLWWRDFLDIMWPFFTFHDWSWRHVYWTSSSTRYNHMVLFNKTSLSAEITDAATTILHETSLLATNRHPLYFNLLTPNDDYNGRTAPLTSKCCILYIYSTNICTEYFKHGIYPRFFPLQNAVCFINLTYLVPVLFTFYIQDVLKFKK